MPSPATSSPRWHVRRYAPLPITALDEDLAAVERALVRALKG
jgi:hypothetical protein